MDFFNYQQGELWVENIPVEKIAREVDSPLYVYSQATFLDHLRKTQKAYAEIDTTICFSIKACGNIHILKLLADSGSGFDIVSGGELFRAKQAGADMKKIVFAGVGKTDREIRQALEAQIGYFNIESEQELENLIKLAKETGNKTKAALRVNPDVDPKTHTFITTGKKETKFGVDIEYGEKIFKKYAGNNWVDLNAIHVHIGSGGNTIEPYVEAVTKTLILTDKLKQAGHEIKTLDLGGGYGADYVTGYGPNPEQYAKGIVPLLKGSGLKLILEPGKSIAANAGILLSRVLYLKKSGQKKFVIVDAGMNDLIRPPLYDAFHFIWPTAVKSEHVPTVRQDAMKNQGLEMVDIVGPICEGTDFFAKERAIPPVVRGDLLAIFTTGAYGSTMSSNYNSRPLIPEVLVNGDSYKIIRRRQTYADLIALEIPENMPV